MQIGNLNFRFCKALNTSGKKQVATGEQSIAFRKQNLPLALQTLGLGNRRLATGQPGSCLYCFLHRAEMDAREAQHFRNTTAWHSECRTEACFSQKYRKGFLFSPGPRRYELYRLNQVKRISWFPSSCQSTWQFVLPSIQYRSPISQHSQRFVGRLGTSCHCPCSMSHTGIYIRGYANPPPQNKKHPLMWKVL